MKAVESLRAGMQIPPPAPDAPPFPLLAKVRESAAAGEDIHAALDMATAASKDPVERAKLNAYRTLLHFEETGRVQQLSRSSPEALLELREIIGPIGRLDIGLRLARKYRREWPQSRPLAITALMLTAAPSLDIGSFRDDVGKDIQVIPNPSARGTIMVFCGVRHSFGVSLNLMQAWLQSLDANIVYLRDFNGLLFLKGLRSEGDLPASVARLRSIASDLGAPLMMLGNSGGVFSALYYATLLDAQRVLLFSGPTSLDIGMEVTEKQVFGQLKAAHEAGDVPWPNLRHLYEKRSDIQVRMYFGKGNEKDNEQAMNLHGLPNVELRPLASSNHFIIDRLVKRATFLRSLRWLTREAPEDDVASPATSSGIGEEQRNVSRDGEPD